MMAQGPQPKALWSQCWDEPAPKVLRTTVMPSTLKPSEHGGFQPLGSCGMSAFLSFDSWGDVIGRELD